MTGKLEEIAKRYKAITKEMMDPDVVSNQKRFRELSIEEATLSGIVEKYNEYKEVQTNLEESMELLEEDDEEIQSLLEKSGIL